jgi:hypothetical protein
MTFAESAKFPHLPSTVMGMAALVGIAYRQGDLASVWSQLLDRYAANPEDAAALMDMSVILQTTGHPSKALEFQQMALELSRSYARVDGDGKGLKVLAFVADGDFMANTPIDFLMEGSNAVLTLYYVDGQTQDLRDVPEHDVAFIAAGESEANVPVLANLERLLEGWQRPIMNGVPRRIAALTRDRVAGMFADEPSIVAPATMRADRATLYRLALGQIGLRALLPNETFPIIVRPYGSHAGDGLEKTDSPAEVAAYLEKRSEQHFYLAPFIDYAGPDGFFRKQRIAVIDGRPFPSHLAVSSHWMVHYLNSGMQENEAWRTEEAAWMRDFDSDFALRHAPAFDALTRKIGLDYFVIDCAEMPDGRLLLFEAQVAMIVHAMDATGIFSYKQPAMRKLFSAFQTALARQCSHVS